MYNIYVLSLPSIGALVGFSNIGDINFHLNAFEKSLVEEEKEEPLAQSMFVLMVRGLFSELKFAYAQFPCNELSGDEMYEPLWDAVGRLERCGVWVMALVCDGLAANKRLFRLYLPDTPASMAYKVPNLYAADGRHLFFLSDPPHLLKIVQNAWSSTKRNLWVRNYYLPPIYVYIMFKVSGEEDCVVSSRVSA